MTESLIKVVWGKKAIGELRQDVGYKLWFSEYSRKSFFKKHYRRVRI